MTSRASDGRDGHSGARGSHTPVCSLPSWVAECCHPRLMLNAALRKHQLFFARFNASRGAGGQSDAWVVGLLGPRAARATQTTLQDSSIDSVHSTCRLVLVWPPPTRIPHRTTTPPRPHLPWIARSPHTHVGPAGERVQRQLRRGRVDDAGPTAVPGCPQPLPHACTHAHVCTPDAAAAPGQRARVARLLAGASGPTCSA